MSLWKYSSKWQAQQQEQGAVRSYLQSQAKRRKSRVRLYTLNPDLTELLPLARPSETAPPTGAQMLEIMRTKTIYLNHYIKYKRLLRVSLGGWSNSSSRRPELSSQCIQIQCPTTPVSGALTPFWFPWVSTHMIHAYKYK